MAYPVAYSIQRPEFYNRWTVLFRIILAIPLFIIIGGFPFQIFALGLPDDSTIRPLLSFLQVISLTTVLGFLVFLSWWGIMFTRRFPPAFLKWSLGLFRWQQNAIAYIYLLTSSYPPIITGPYELNLEIIPTVDHSRATTFFRVILVIPIAIVLWFLSLALIAVTFFAWWVIMFTRQYPRSMHELAVGIARLSCRVSAYLYLFVDDYPPFSLSEEAGETPPTPLQPQLA
jgi:membrane protease YdiL (CAAX protease family)